MEKSAIKGNFDWKTQDIVPSFAQGQDAKALYDLTEEIRTGTMGYDEKTRIIYGSTPFLAARIDTIVKNLGFRAANLRDLSSPEIMSMVKGKFYTDSPTLILRSLEDSNSKNLPLIEKIVQEVERVNGSLKLPVMVSGFDVQPSQDDGYKIMIVPRDDFLAIHDERLSGDYHGEKFSEVDELGLPKFDKKGARIWYARNQGLSRSCLGTDLSVFSNNEYLDDSISYGRVVIVGGKASARKNLDRH